MLDTLPPAPGFALADCNNFYASAERVFRPDLWRRPVIVLGNNDGNVIARSPEAKALGIPMGAPIFQLDRLIARHRVAVCSANFALYGDVSSRVMGALSRFTPTLDQYSIDEAFLDLAAIPPCAWEAHAREARAAVVRWTGIPISIGAAPTKTLAKLAADKAKQTPSGVLSLATQEAAHDLLRATPVGDIWGIGGRRAATLAAHGVTTAYDFAYGLDPAWVKRRLTVMGARTQLELRGVSCLPLVIGRASKKEVCCSRSFKRPVKELDDIQQAVAQYASWAAEKARAQETAATALTVFVGTSVFRTSAPQYHSSATLPLPRATSDTLEIVAAALLALERIYRAGIEYHKVGVMLSGMAPASPAQLTLLDAPPDARREELMRVMDAINGRFGHDTIRTAAAGTDQPWRARPLARSPRYTTCWQEIPQAK